tara:strand:- start:44 stop:256 length:213 start_codon:yes stop_codon:yes gene_type:complete
MKKIRINGIEGYYYIEDNALIYNSDDLQEEVEVSDLTDLTIYQYNELVKNIWAYFPEVDEMWNRLEGRFI